MIRTYIIDWINYSNKQIEDIQNLLNSADAQIRVFRYRAPPSIGDCHVLAAKADLTIYSYTDVKTIVNECIIQLCKINNF